LQEADVQLVVVGCSKVKFIKVKFSVAFVICYIFITEALVDFAET